MRAVLFSGKFGEVEMADVDLDKPGPGEVRVKIAATGVCHSDLHIIRNEWPLPVPMVLGHEGSGTVTELGEGVTDLAVGDHVVLSWVAPCNECRYCKSGHVARCSVAMNLVATTRGCPRSPRRRSCPPAVPFASARTRPWTSSVSSAVRSPPASAP